MTRKNSGKDSRMADTSQTQERLLAELEDLLRTMPAKEKLGQTTDENLAWLGRAAAIIEQWNMPKTLLFNLALDKFHDQVMPLRSGLGFREIMTLLHQARSDLRMRTVGPTNIALPQGGVFDYFDEVRKTVELADSEVFFVDPYLDAEFVSRYLPHVRTGVTIRLLTSDKKLSTLLPAVDLFIKQNGRAVSVRSANGLHDRYVFIDKGSCYQSGASFKDGAKLAPTTLTQITDAFSPVWDTYERLWAAANVER
jgi:hypothetical protein